jgi:methyl-accepting chemotaxis protein
MVLLPVEGALYALSDLASPVAGGRNRLTLRTQLLFALGLLAALPVVVLGIVQAESAAAGAATLADRETLLASTSLARELGRLMEAHANTARVLAAEVGAAGRLDTDTSGRRAEVYIRVFPGLYGVMTLDMEGVAIGGAVLGADGVPKASAGRAYGDRMWVRELQKGGPFSVELLRSRVSGRPAVSLAMPIVDGAGNRSGMIGLGIDLDLVQRALERVTEAAPGVASVVLDRGGRIVAAAGSERVTPLAEFGDLPLYGPPAGDGPERRTGISETGELRRGTVAPVQTSVVRWWVTTTWPQAEVRQRAVEALMVMSSFGIGALLFGLAAAVLLARTIALPVSRLSTLVEAIGKGDLRVRPERPKSWYPRELGELVASIDRMLAQLHPLVAQLRRTVVAIGDVTQRLHGASANMVGDSYEQHQAVRKSSGAIVQMSDSIGHVGSSARSLSEAASETIASILSLDRQIDRIGHSLRTVGDTIDGAAIEVTQMHDQVGAVAATTLQLGENVDKTSGSLRELTESIQQVAGSAEQGQALSHEALAAAEAGRDAVDETIGATREIQHRFSAVGEAVLRLAGRSEAIGEVVRVIDEVTRATQLLAINASIIATEAGEHGKGFHVVADRVRSMAAETAESTHQITRLVASVQADIQQAVEAVHSGQETVRAGERRSEEAGVRLRAIIDSSGQAEKTVQKIAEATRDQALRVRSVVPPSPTSNRRPPVSKARSKRNDRPSTRWRLPSTRCARWARTFEPRSRRNKKTAGS